MSKTNPNEINFYDFYAKRNSWKEEEAVTLSLNINPRSLITNGRLKNDQGDYYTTEFCTKYNERMELVKEGVLHNTISNNRWSEVHPLSFINWCKDRDISFPEGLEILVRKYNRPPRDEIDWEGKYKALEIENSKLKEEIELNPSTKEVNSLRKLNIGVMLIHYGKEKISLLTNRSSLPPGQQRNNLTYAEISRDLKKIDMIMDDETISKCILKSEKYLPPTKLKI